MPNKMMKTGKTSNASFEDLRKSVEPGDLDQVRFTMQLSQLKLSLDLANTAMRSLQQSSGLR